MKAQHMKLTYVGTGTVSVPGVGEVSQGEVISVPNEIGICLVVEQPENWSSEKHEKPPASPGRARRE